MKTALKPGMPIEHPEFGRGEVVDIVGAMVRARFLGEEIDVDRDSVQILHREESPRVKEQGRAVDLDIDRFLQALEAINLGVVPQDAAQLIALSMRGDQYGRQIESALDGLYKNGLCRAVFGHYGSGKTHYLRLVRAQALRAGYAVAYIEFDPKAADPAKPHLVYRYLMSALELPQREDGTRESGFAGLIGEVRKRWYRHGIAAGRWIQLNPWFRDALSVLLEHEHDLNDDVYTAAIAWLAGERAPLRLLHELARLGETDIRVPRMPVSKETSEIYAFHLVVVAELCRAVGYKGLLLILDEAEHVRGFNVRRRERANNLFDMLSRCANRPIDNEPAPVLNEHDHRLPDFWRKGPHFGVYVGLTEGDTFAEPNLSLRDACVFVREEADRILIKPPSQKDYEAWCEVLLRSFAEKVPESGEVFRDVLTRQNVAKILGNAMGSVRAKDVMLRDWTKLAGMACAVTIVRDVKDARRIYEILRESAAALSAGY